MSEVLNQSQSLNRVLKSFRNTGKKIGFVPTMGALHQGHLSLIDQCRQENSCCVVSIFVNPTQFNDKNDYTKYPRLLDQDLEKISSLADFIFVPDEAEIYPEGNYEIIKIDLGKTGTIMEASMRLGHFDGVVTVVKKLFDIVKPDAAYFGQKDFQQFCVIRKLVETFGMDMELKLCPTIREKDGLAMSSRNLLLSEDERKVAPLLYETLTMAGKLLGVTETDKIKNQAEQRLKAEKIVNFEYFEIVDADSLEPVSSLENHRQVLIAVAAKVGKIRLIDNIIV